MFLGGVTTVVRDLVDHKGTVHPDIGSIVAYALSSSEYEAKRKNMREIRSSNGVPITLRLGCFPVFLRFGTNFYQY